MPKANRRVIQAQSDRRRVGWAFRVGRPKIEPTPEPDPKEQILLISGEGAIVGNDQTTINSLRKERG